MIRERIMKMRWIKRIMVFVGICVSMGSLLAREAAKDGGARDRKPLKVLMIGNSFTGSVMSETPAMAKKAGLRLDIVQCGIGGCPFDRHWSNVEKSGDKSFKPYGIRPSLASGGESAFYDTYQPYADNLISKIRELAPQAEIVIQQTWSYSPYAVRLEKWKMTPKGMYEALKKSYAQLAAKHSLRIIPTADAVQLFRDRLPVDYGKLLTREEISNIKEPETLDFHGDVVGSSAWKQGRKGKQKDWEKIKLRCDFSHFNARGHYLQACVWLGFLFDVDPTTFTYCPKGLPVADAKLMRECARDALKASK